MGRSCPCSLRSSAKKECLCLANGDTVHPRQKARCGTLLQCPFYRLEIAVKSFPECNNGFDGCLGDGIRQVCRVMTKLRGDFPAGDKAILWNGSTVGAHPRVSAMQSKESTSQDGAFSPGQSGRGQALVARPWYWLHMTGGWDLIISCVCWAEVGHPCGFILKG